MQEGLGGFKPHTHVALSSDAGRPADMTPSPHSNSANRDWHIALASNAVATVAIESSPPCALEPEAKEASSRRHGPPTPAQPSLDEVSERC